MQRIHVTIRPLNREDSVLYFPPEAFGPFRVLHQIGAGTLGPVFRAYEPGRDRLVAVKVFRLDLTPEQAAGLVAELQALEAVDISHPNIAAPIAAGQEHGAVFLAQEYAVGDSLDVVLRERGPMSIRDVVALVDSLAGAIDHAAGRGVHHGLLHLRDIVVSADAVRITGFGIASALSKIGAKLPTRPQYSSPDARFDVYSLGAIAFEAATGKRVSAENLKEFEAEHGAVLRGAFGVPLAAPPDLRPERAGAFAAVLREATGMIGATGAVGAIGAIGATGAAPAPVPSSEPVAPTAPIAPVAPAAAVTPAEPITPIEPVVSAVAPVAPIENVAPIAPTAPIAPSAPIAPTAPIAPVAPAVDPLDRVIELGSSHHLNVDAQDFAAEVAPTPPSSHDEIDIEPEPSRRRWPMVATLLAFAVLVAVAVGFFLQAPRSTPATEPGVDSTVVDVPAPAPVAPTAPVTPSPPAPTPSRPASGAVQRVQTGSVLIRSTPADADVLVNGKPRGKTPLALRDLALGSYTIRVARDGYAPEERTLEITSQRPTASTTIDLRELKTGPGGLNVQSRPAGASVYVNDRLAGSTPIAIPGLPAGPATVRIELDGYEPWTTTVSVGAGEQTRVGASLEKK